MTVKQLYRRARLARGLCPDCANPVAEGHTACVDCRRKQKRRNIRNYPRRRARGWKSKP